MLIRPVLGCLGLMFLLGMNSAHQDSKPNTKTYTQDAGSKQKLPMPSVVEPSYSGFIDQSACQPSQDSHDKELCIAWRATMAAEDQARWAKVASLVGVLGIFLVVRTLHYTRKAAEAAQASAQAAERSVAESAKTLAHAQDVAARDLRPWLTVEAALDGPITIDKLSQIMDKEDRFELFARLRFQNVGRSAARNVIYRLSAADFGEVSDPDKWFDDVVQKAILASEACLHDPSRRGFDLFDYNDSLAPSEGYGSRRWCSFKGTTPSNQPVWKGYEFCVCVVAAYMGTSDDEVFYTAKVFPVGFPEVPTFQRFISPERLPIGTGDVAFGPVRKARAT